MSSAATEGLATCNVVCQQNVGDMIDFVIKVNSVQENQHTISDEPYLCISGSDMDGVNVRPLFMWLFKEGEIVTQRIYILRAMRVCLETCWCEWSHCYVPYADERRKIECSFRTAVEDVTDVQFIQGRFF